MVGKPIDTMHEDILTILEAISTLLQPPILQTGLLPHTAIHSSRHRNRPPPETYLPSLSPLSPMSNPRPLKTTSVRSEAYLMLSNARSSSPKACFVKTPPLPKGMKLHPAERGRRTFRSAAILRLHHCLQFPLCISMKTFTSRIHAYSILSVSIRRL